MKFFLRSFAPLACAEVISSLAASIALVNRKDAVAELFSGKFKDAYSRDPSHFRKKPFTYEL
jgi:hypothetical protein